MAEEKLAVDIDSLIAKQSALSKEFFDEENEEEKSFSQAAISDSTSKSHRKSFSINQDDDNSFDINQIIRDLEPDSTDDTEIQEIVNQAKINTIQKGISNTYQGRILSQEQLENFQEDYRATSNIKRDIKSLDNVLEPTNLDAFLLLQSKLTGVPLELLLKALKDNGELIDLQESNWDDIIEEVEEEDDTEIEYDTIAGNGEGLDSTRKKIKPRRHKGPIQTSNIVFAKDGFLYDEDTAYLKERSDINDWFDGEDADTGSERPSEVESNQSTEIQTTDEVIEEDKPPTEESTEIEEQVNEQEDKQEEVEVNNVNFGPNGVTIKRKINKPKKIEKPQVKIEDSDYPDEKLDVVSADDILVRNQLEVNTGKTYSLKDLDVDENPNID